MHNIHYFGILKDTTDPDRRQIQVLGEFAKHPTSGLEVTVPGFDSFVGPSGYVHWYRNRIEPSQFRHIPENCIVRFSCDPDYSEPDLSKDRRRVHLAEVSLYGAFVLPESRCVGWENGQAICDLSLPQRVNVFILTSDRLNIIGPWRSEKIASGTKLEPKSSTTVHRCSVASLKQNQIVLYPHSAYNNVSVIGVNEIPPKSDLIDVSTPTQLANWLLKKLDSQISHDKIQKLEVTNPGWKNAMRDAVKNATPEEQQKWARVEKNLDSILVDSKILSRILNSNDFEARIENAIQAEIEKSAERIIRESEKKVRENCKLLEAEICVLEKMKQSLEDACEIERQRVKEPMQDLESLKNTIRMDFLKLANQTAVVASLLQSQSVSIATVESKESTEKSALPCPCREPEQLEIVPVASFVSKRFLPCLNEKQIGMKSDVASAAVATVIACRAIVIPELRMFSAISNAMNSESYIVACNPRWISWADFWDDMGTFWESSSDLSRFKFLLIQDFNIASPEVWGRPLLNLLSNECQLLPNGKPWPVRFRLFLSPSPKSIGLPVELATLAHFPGIGLEALYSKSLSDGEYCFDRFSSVIQSPSKRRPIEPVELDPSSLEIRETTYSTDLGIAPKEYFSSIPIGLARDLNRIVEVLVSMGLNQEEAIDAAQQIRCRWIKT